MFVTMQCFNNLDGEEEKLPMTERFGLTMRRAGAAITITSLTDFLAFAVGGTTVRNYKPRIFVDNIMPWAQGLYNLCFVDKLAIYLCFYIYININYQST